MLRQFKTGLRESLYRMAAKPHFPLDPRISSVWEFLLAQLRRSGHLAWAPVYARLSATPDNHGENAMSQQAPVQTLMACSQCGRTFAPSDLVQIAGNWVCADCKPAFLSRVMASGVAGASPLSWRYGGFWIRFGARMVDGFVLLVPFGIIAALFIPSLLRPGNQVNQGPNALFAGIFLTVLVVYFLIATSYEVVMLKNWGATVGKMACGLRVIRSDGRGLGWGVSLGRYFMWNIVTSGVPYLNVVLMSVSAIMVGTDSERRALHDRVCDTRVVYKQSVA